MAARRALLFLFNVLLVQNISTQILPLGGCGCQQISVPQSVPVPSYQVASGCGCARNNLPISSLPNGIQYTNTIQIAKTPCGCVPSNLQVGGVQNSYPLANIGNPCQLANGLQMANSPLTQNDLLALMNGIPMSNTQNVLQLTMQALLNQLGTNLPGNCQCGCQQGLIQSPYSNNLNLLGLNGYSNAVSNVPLALPSSPCSNVQMVNSLNGMPVTGTQEIVLNTSPCPCQTVQNPNPMSFSMYQ